MSTATPVEVLVTDGNRRPALAVVRSLARHGVSFVVLGDMRGSLAFSSRYAKHTAVCPSPATEPDAFFEFVLSTVKQRGIRLVIPVLERACRCSIDYVTHSNSISYWLRPILLHYMRSRPQAGTALFR